MKPVQLKSKSFYLFIITLIYYIEKLNFFIKINNTITYSNEVDSQISFVKFQGFAQKNIEFVPIILREKKFLVFF